MKKLLRQNEFKVEGGIAESIIEQIIPMLRENRLSRKITCFVFYKNGYSLIDLMKGGSELFGELYGPYVDHADVLRGIHSLQEKGYKSKEIILMADTSSRLYFEKKQKVRLETLEERNRFLQTLKRISFGRKPSIEGLVGQDYYLGLTNEEKQDYYDHLKEGKIYLYILPENVHEAPQNDSSMDVYDLYHDSQFRIKTKGL